MKYQVDVKFVFDEDNPNKTQKRLKQTLKKIMNIPGLDIFLRHPADNRYDRVMK